MQKSKIFILLPDGIGLRNYAFTNFFALGSALGYDLTFWNITAFDLKKLGFREIKITHSELHPKTDLLKKAKALIELDITKKKTKDAIYDFYRHKLYFKSVKDVVKSVIIKTLEHTYSFSKIRKSLQAHERKTKYYHDCLETLKAEKPELVFCTNHRTTKALAPIAAAKDLGIPTATFIFSWDNLPKATKVIETDFYFVWSDHMKSELLSYYPYINENQVVVTGTTQFEPHYDENLIASREVFFKSYKLLPSRKYICYSGDDITTSPNDPQYLADVADAVLKLNAKGHDLGIIFRRAPVDFSSRFDEVLKKHQEIITAIDPEWEVQGAVWNTVLPTREDVTRQMNTIYHSEMVINLGSSMVFDYVAHDKPCAYINYDIPTTEHRHVSVKTIYNFVHFRSMTDRKAVIWLDRPEAIADEIEKVLSGNTQSVEYAKEWFRKINLHPPQEASKRIFDAIGKIISEKTHKST